MSGRTKDENIERLPMDEGRKRVLGIIAGILVVRDLKTSEDLIETRSIPSTESIICCYRAAGGEDHAEN